MTILTRRTYLIISACVALTACSGAPSESQMNDALQAQTKKEQEAAEKMFGSMGGDMAKGIRAMTGELKRLHKIGCKEDGDKAYRCDVELEYEKGGKSTKLPASFRFLKGSEGWMVVG